jgi:hypothetical protein
MRFFTGLVFFTLFLAKLAVADEASSSLTKGRALEDPARNLKGKVKTKKTPAPKKATAPKKSKSPRAPQKAKSPKVPVSKAKSPKVPVSKAKAPKIPVAQKLSRV